MQDYMVILDTYWMEFNASKTKLIKCDFEAYWGDKVKLIVPDGIVCVGKYCCFCEIVSDSWTLSEVVLPDSVRIIGDNAFLGCHGLKKITLPPNLKIIGERAFEGCGSLEEIMIPNAVKYIGKNAFADCKEVKIFNCFGEITQFIR